MTNDLNLVASVNLQIKNNKSSSPSKLKHVKNCKREKMCVAELVKQRSIKRFNQKAYIVETVDIRTYG